MSGDKRLDSIEANATPSRNSVNGELEVISTDDRKWLVAEVRRLRLEHDAARAEVERLRDLVRQACGLADIFSDESKARESTMLGREVHIIRVSAGLGPSEKEASDE